jgi:DHA2 family multidrug resistance protein
LIASCGAGRAATAAPLPKMPAAVAFGTLDARHYAEASAVFHLLRNIGSSFFISLSIAEIAVPGMIGAWNFDTVPGLARMAKEIMRQAMMIGYLNAFTMYTATSALAVILALMARSRRT